MIDPANLQEETSPGTLWQPEESAPRPWPADDDYMRGLIAVILVGTLALCALASLFLITFLRGSSDAAEKALSVILGTLGGLVGAVTGFYYGTRSNVRSESSRRGRV